MRAHIQGNEDRAQTGHFTHKPGITLQICNVVVEIYCTYVNFAKFLSYSRNYLSPMLGGPYLDSSTLLLLSDKGICSTKSDQ